MTQHLGAQVAAVGTLFSTIDELAPRLADGSLAAVGLLAERLDQIQAHDRQGVSLAAVLQLNPGAEAEACALDRERGRSGVRGPFHGIPVVLKDNIDMAGLPTTSGNPAMATAVALRDAEQTRRLRQAGAVVIAKTNLSEFSFDIISRSSLGGDVRNPFNPQVTAGGSSGGTAAAVAAGFAVMGVGTDTGGSIRVPAAFNGLVGLRPSWGLISLQGVTPLAPTTDTIGPIARCVNDIAHALAVMADGELNWRSRPAPRRRTLAGARIGVLRQVFGDDDAIQGAMAAAMAVMEDAGATMVNGQFIPDDLRPDRWANVVDWEFASAFDAYLTSSFAAGGAPASLVNICSTGAYLPEHREDLLRRAAVTSLDAPAYIEILDYHRHLRAALAAAMDEQRLAAFIYPTSAVTPKSLDKPRGGWAPELAACTGWPALTLPVGQASNGVPIGMEFLGRAFEEGLLIDLAGDLERKIQLRYVPNLL